MRPRRTIQNSTFLLWQAAKPITTFKIRSVAHSGARTWCHACMVGVVAAAILADRSSRKQNTLLIMILYQLIIAN